MLHSTLTCPDCGHRSLEQMPVDACQFVHVCANCSARLRPKTGDCCVFCSYGDVACPPVQADHSCCGG
ncbi:GDCCVxC domain-containing (seleno)protein [Falsigemmobacter faecalis]